MKPDHITIEELARRAAVRFLWDDCKTHPRFEALIEQARRSDMKVAAYKGAPPQAVLEIIHTIHGLDTLEPLANKVAGIIRDQGNASSVEGLRPEAMRDISATIALTCDDSGLGGMGLTTKGVFDTLAAERSQLMMEGIKP